MPKKAREEREPDLIGPNDKEIEEKVRDLMDLEAEDSKKAKAAEVKNETATAPEVTELPKPKEPLKIKILKDDPEDSKIETAESDEPTTAPEPPTAKKKITVDHNETETEEPEKAAELSEMSSEPVAPLETLAPEIAEQATNEPEEAEKEPQKTEHEEEQEELPPALEDEKTAKAVDDIVAHEGDELLAAEDEKVAAALAPTKKISFGHRFRHFLAAWWRNPKARYLTLTVVFLAIVAAIFTPKSRYFLLNTAGVRSSLSVQILDQSTQQPLKNVRVIVGDATGLTGTDGKAKLLKVKLGPSDITIEKRAFAPIHQSITVGWGSNPIGSFTLTPTGTQYAFVVTDYLSGKGIPSVEASSGDASALSDQDGKILLTMDQPDDQFDVSLHKDQLRDEKLMINANDKATHNISMVPSRKEVFISKRSGKYDVYKIDIDGKNEEKVLAGTGLERDDMVLVSHPTDEEVAMVSTRENKRNQDGFLLSTLSLINLSDNQLTTITQSERVQILDWIGDRLVYVQVAQGASAANPKRNRLMSYNYKTGENTEIAASNYFNDVAVIGTKIYYAPSSTYQNGVDISFFKVDADGSNRQAVLSKEVWNFFRTSFDHLILSTADNQWYDYKLGDKTPAKLDGQPGNLDGRVYSDSPDGKKSLWVDQRDGKGVLLAYEPSTQNEQTLHTQSGLKRPVRWLTDNIVIYRINTDQETADYALSLNGGEPKKVRDVTNTGGVDKWYYY